LSAEIHVEVLPIKTEVLLKENNKYHYCYLAHRLDVQCWRT